MVQTIRNLTLLLTLGFFLSAATASACDGDKTACKGHTKVTKTAMKDCSKCMKKGKCTMTAAEMKKSGCCTEVTKASAMSMKAGNKAQCPAGVSAHGDASGAKHDCCKAKTGADKS